MRVIDLLQLLKDLNRNLPIYFEWQKKTFPISGTLIEPLNPDVTATLLELNETSPKALKNWELMVLLNRPEQLPNLVYVKLPHENYPIFGVRMTKEALYLG